VTVPPGFGSESRRTSEALTQSAPGFGVGFGVGFGLGDFDGDGLGDLDGEELGLLDGEVLFDGLVVLVGLLDGVGLLVGLGLVDGLELPVGLGLVTLGPESNIMLACTTAVAAEPQRLRSGTAGSASAGAIAGPDNRKIPAPAATAACPARTTLTGTVALR
jgi:hypothetical protein